jgi:hypothetical protein
MSRLDMKQAVDQKQAASARPGRWYFSQKQVDVVFVLVLGDWLFRLAQSRKIKP